MFSDPGGLSGSKDEKYRNPVVLAVWFHGNRDLSAGKTVVE